ncbi:MAG: molybdopterin-dependent oxidoreductase, partial [Acidimicrobiia bacterium]|nr:molybdopterin-dependent oxidoreductase [Acidimicrobiia bacterium]
DRPILARTLIQHVGEPLALVVAVDPVVVADAVELVEFDLQALPAIVDGTDAVDAAPIHPGAASNIVAVETIGDPAAGWDDPAIDTIVEISVVNQRVAPVTLEPLSILVVPDPTPSPGATTVHVGHQAPHLLKKQLQRWFSGPIEVMVPDVGGGYGLKARLYPEYVAVVAAALTHGRPVRWLQTRSEQFASGCHGRDMLHRVRLGGTEAGRILRVDIDFVLTVGAYPHLGAMVADFTRLVSQQLYDIENISVRSTVVATNTAPVAPYRGAGRPEAAYAMERAVDAFARRIGADPLAVRACNLLRPATWPHRTGTGALYDSGDYRAALDRLTELVDVPAVRLLQSERLAAHTAGPHTGPDGKAPPGLIGLGVGAWVERAGGAPDAGEYALVEATTGGRLKVLTGSTDNGQGHETVWAQVAGRAFGLEASSVVDRVSVTGGDTVQVPRGSGSSASRSAQIGASAVYRCAHRLQQRLATVAASVLEAAPADIIVVDGVFQVRGVPSSSLELGAVVGEATKQQVATAEDEWYVPGAQTFPYGVHAAVVEVDPETGFVRVLRYVAVDDCGVVLHPEMVEGQTVGSVAQGIGQALFEQIVYRPDGQLLTGTLLDYGIPGPTDVPPIETARLEHRAPSNTLGVKGAGEGGCIGAPPAVVNAVLDALAPIGVEHLDMPLHPERVWRAIEHAAGATP